MTVPEKTANPKRNQSQLKTRQQLKTNPPSWHFAELSTQSCHCPTRRQFWHRVLAGLAVTFVLMPSSVPSLPALAQSQTPYEDCQQTGLTAPEVVQHPTSTENALRFREAWSHSDGAGVAVAVIDTGVAKHPRLGEVADGGDVVEGIGAFYDCDAHGTFVAGIIAGQPGPDSFAGVAPGAHLLSIRQTAGDDGDLFGLADAIHKALELQAKVINISLTSCAPTDVVPPGAAEVTNAVQRAEHDGAVVIAASGNRGSHCEQGHIAWPAILPEVIATAAVEYSVDGEPLPAEYSITGAWVDIAAPGGPIWGPDPRQTDTDQPISFANAHTARSGESRPIFGTSFAAPVVSGTVALMLAANPNLAPGEVRNLIGQSARPVSRALGIGTGVVDPVAAVSWVTKDDENGRPLPHMAGQSAPTPPDVSPANRVFTLFLLLAVGIPAGFLIHRGTKT